MPATAHASCRMLSIMGLHEPQYPPHRTTVAIAAAAVTLAAAAVAIAAAAVAEPASA